MSCGFARLLVWTLRSWFASDRSLPALAALELAWIERDLAVEWPRLARFLSILDFERERDLDVGPPGSVAAGDAPLAGLTADEAAIVAALTCARWSAPEAARCLAGILDRDSVAAAVRVAARLGARRAPASRLVPARPAEPVSRFTPVHEDSMMKLTMHATPPSASARASTSRAFGATVALGLALAAPAAFAGPQCTKADRAQWQDAAKFQEQLKAQGYRIKVFKVTDGNCYEIYGWDKQNRKVEIYFDPVSGKALKTEIG